MTLTRLIASSILVSATLLVTSSGCGGVRHAVRDGAGGVERDPTLVEVRTTGADSGYKVVSFSIWDVDLNEELPKEAPDDVLFSMRAAAASHGAEILLIERWEDPYRRAFYGTGAVRTDGEVPAVGTCDHPSFAAVLEGVDRIARQCARRLKKQRPALRGMVEAIFEVDPYGQALRVAPTPDSSRDSGLQGCVIQKVYSANWGQPKDFTCKGFIKVDLSDLGAAPDEDDDEVDDDEDDEG